MMPRVAVLGCHWTSLGYQRAAIGALFYVLWNRPEKCAAIGIPGSTMS